MMQNLKFALRLLFKSPAFTSIAVLVMALGIGANTAIFSVVHSVLLSPLPFHDADRLVQLWHTPPQSSFPGVKIFSLSAANFLDWQNQSHSFDAIALYTGAHYDLTGSGKPEAVTASPVTYNFFSVLGAQPILGRTFLPEEDRPGANHEAILSHRFWQSHFASDPAIIGKSIQIDGEPYSIVGVMGPKIIKPDYAQIWTPLGLTPQQAAVRGEHHYSAVARLKPGVTLEQAQSELDAISLRLAQSFPADDKGWGASVHSLREETIGDVRPALLMMLGAVAFVLLIACANVANLVLARTLARRKEIAIRSALGATRARMVLQLLTESVLLSLAGGALGLLFAHFGIQLLLKFFADKLPRMADIGLDLPVLAFTFALSIATGILAGLIPALSMAGRDISNALKQGLGRTDSDGGKSKTRSTLVVTEVALSLVLLVGAGLMIRSLINLQHANAGFDPHNVLTMSVGINRKQFTDPAQESRFFAQVLDRIRALPGVTAAGAIDNLPLTGGSNQPLVVEGRPAVAMSEQPEVSVRTITPGYANALRIPVLEGRALSASDTADSAPVVLISQSMAKQFWPNASPIGRHVTLTFFPGKAREIVGVVGDVKQEGLDSSAGIATLYWPLSQVTASSTAPWTSYPLFLAVRTSTPPQSLAGAIADAVHQAGKDIPVDQVITLEDFVGETLTQQTFNMELLAIFAALALTLSAVGIYSVLAYSVRRRMKEIGLRVALGASLREVVRLVILQGMKPTLAGIALGLIAALALSRLIAGMIYGVDARDLSTFVAVTALLVLVSFFASLIPALRATRVDPLSVLRDE